MSEGQGAQIAREGDCCKSIFYNYACNDEREIGEPNESEKGIENSRHLFCANCLSSSSKPDYHRCN